MGSLAVEFDAGSPLKNQFLNGLLVEPVMGARSFIEKFPANPAGDNSGNGHHIARALWRRRPLP